MKGYNISIISKTAPNFPIVEEDTFPITTSYEEKFTIRRLKNISFRSFCGQSTHRGFHG